MFWFSVNVGSLGRELLSTVPKLMRPWYLFREPFPGVLLLRSIGFRH